MSKSRDWDLDVTLHDMRHYGGFYAMHRRGLRPALWRLAGRRGVAPVTPDWLYDWILRMMGESHVPPGLVNRVMRSDLSGFPVITEDTAKLVSP